MPTTIFERLEWRPQPSTWLAVTLVALMAVLFPFLTPEIGIEHGALEWMQVVLLFVMAALLGYLAMRRADDREMRSLWLLLLIVPTISILREVDWGKSLIDFDVNLFVSLGGGISKRLIRNVLLFGSIGAVAVAAFRSGAFRALECWIRAGRLPAIDVVLLGVTVVISIGCERVWFSMDRPRLRLLEELCESGAILIALGILISLSHNPSLQPPQPSRFDGT